MTAAAAHFKGRSRPLLDLERAELPVVADPQRLSPKLYRGLYEAGYKAIKAVDSHAQVLIGETVPYDDPGIATAPLKWLRAVAC